MMTSHLLPSARSRRTVLALAIGVILATGGIAATAQPASAAPLQAIAYASPSGTGATCSQAAPCSLSAAQTKIRALTSSMTGDLVVQLAGGTYALSAPLTLTALDSGTNGFTVAYRAAPGAEPVLSGGRTISGWTLADATKNIWQASVPVGFAARQLYVNDRRADLAQQPSSILGTVTETATGYTIANAAMAGWVRPTDIDFVYPAGGMTPTVHGGWTSSLCSIAAVTGDTVTMQQPCWKNARDSTYGPGVNVPTYIQNNYALLSEPGHFYINSASGVASYIPRAGENLSTASVVAPALQNLILGAGTSAAHLHDLEISGLTLKYATWLPSAGDGVVPIQANALEYGTATPPTLKIMPSGVQFHAADRVLFARNSLSHFGGAGVSFDGGGSHNSLVGNAISDVAGSGIQIDNPAWPGGAPASTETGYTVTNNYIHDVATTYLGGIGIFAGFVAGTTIAHNEIFNLPYSGISLGWGWDLVTPSVMSDNHVDYNYIHSVMNADSSMQDGGGIYLNSLQSQTHPSTMRGNYITDITNLGWGMYLDNSSNYWTVSENVLVRGRSGWIQNGYLAKNNAISSNYIDSDRKLVGDPSNVFTNNHESLTVYPPAAQTIMVSAGLESEYVGIRGGPVQSDLATTSSLTVSSTYNGTFPASASIDGYAETGWSAAATDTAGFWRADLGAGYALSSSQLLFRQDIDQEVQRQNFSVRVSNNSDMSGAVTACAQGSTALPFRSTYNCALPSGTWRYVEIKKSDAGNMFLNEVRIFGARDSNLALNKPATASSVYSAAFPVAAANDGSLTSVWSSTGTDLHPYWQVDLGQQYGLSLFQLATRRTIDQYMVRQNFEVWVSNSADMTASHAVACSYGTPPLPHEATYSCTLPPGPFRYVRVVKTDTWGFDMAEVRVFGH
jgi:hypothetical protein